MTDKDLTKLEQEFDMDHAEPEEIVEDLAFYRTLLANVCMIGKPNSDNWVLVDTGVAHYSKRIIAAAEKRFGNTPPKAIILTHGHFDHVGSAKDLAKYWDIPIYVHSEELGFVTDKEAYPPADPTIDGGSLSLLSPLFPQRPVNLKKWVQTLPENGSIPFLDEWKVIHTPGHCRGHIVLFRERDRALITGDAIVTEKPGSTIAALIPIQKVYGPPAHFTSDWDEAEKSVKKLAELKPDILISGHGLPMEGNILREQLDDLANNFIDQAIPKHKHN